MTLSDVEWMRKAMIAARRHGIEAHNITLWPIQACQAFIDACTIIEDHWEWRRRNRLPQPASRDQLSAHHPPGSGAGGT